MLIFDHFPNKLNAEAFSETIFIMLGLKTIICDNQEESNKIDPFPGKLIPPIVLVERTTFKIENKMIKTVLQFKGNFAGT